MECFSLRQNHINKNHPSNLHQNINISNINSDFSCLVKMISTVYPIGEDAEEAYHYLVQASYGPKATNVSAI